MLTCDHARDLGLRSLGFFPNALPMIAHEYGKHLDQRSHAVTW